jgi:medium-chain acyl-[acyl-carrier-protein] hydrolase
MNDRVSSAQLRAVSCRSEAPWLVRFQATPQPALRLFCFPYAGGSASVFRAWGAAMDPRIDVVAVQLPGRGMRWDEAPAVDFELLVDLVADAIVRAAGALRFGFFGHSLGALLMFEVARRLHSQGARLPECVFASGRQAPHLPPGRRREPAISDADFIDELRRLDGTPREILDNPELLAILMPMLRGDFALLDNWRFAPAPPLDLPLFALAGRSDAHVAVESVAAWSQWTSCNFELMTYAGGHFFLHEHEPRVVRDVSERLSALLCG